MKLSNIFKALREEFEQEPDAVDQTDAQREEYFKRELTSYITNLPAVAVLKSNPKLAQNTTRVDSTIKNTVQKLKTHPIGSQIQDDAYATQLVTDILISTGILKSGDAEEALPFEESFKSRRKRPLSEKYDIAKGNEAKDSSGYAKSKETKVNYSEQEKAQSKKQADEMSTRVKGDIEKIIRKHISSAKWNSEDMTWTCKIPVKIATRTRLTGYEWFEKPQKLIDLENELRSLYYNFIGKIAWDEEGTVTIPLKNVALTESRKLDSVNSLLESMQSRLVNEDEDTYKRKVRPNKTKYTPDAVEFKSSLERIANEVWNASDVDSGKKILIDYIEASKINDHSKKKMKLDINAITNKRKLDFYVANSLLKYEKLGLHEESHNMSLEKAKAEAKRISREEGVVQHVEETEEGSGKYRISDWYDSDLTVVSYENGEEL